MKVPIGAVSVSVIVTLLSLPASILGNEAALRYGRHRAIKAVMLASAAVALVIASNAGASSRLLLPLVLLFGLTVPADSGALTSGTSASATPLHRGATLGLHSTIGFGLSALGAWGVGVAIDAAGGPESPTAWMAMFALLASGILLGPLALIWSRAGRPADHPSLSGTAVSAERWLKSPLAAAAYDRKVSANSPFCYRYITLTRNLLAGSNAASSAWPLTVLMA